MCICVCMFREKNVQRFERLVKNIHAVDKDGRREKEREGGGEKE